MKIIIADGYVYDMNEAMANMCESLDGLADMRNDVGTLIELPEPPAHTTLSLETMDACAAFCDQYYMKPPPSRDMPSAWDNVFAKRSGRSIVNIMNVANYLGISSLVTFGQYIMVNYMIANPIHKVAAYLEVDPTFTPEEEAQILAENSVSSSSSSSS